MSDFFFFSSFILFLNFLDWEYIVPGWSHVDIACFCLLCFVFYDGNYYIEALVGQVAHLESLDLRRVNEYLNICYKLHNWLQLFVCPSIPVLCHVILQCLPLGTNPYPGIGHMTGFGQEDVSFATQVKSWNALVQLNLHTCTFAITLMRRMCQDNLLIPEGGQTHKSELLPDEPGQDQLTVSLRRVSESSWNQQNHPAAPDPPRLNQPTSSQGTDMWTLITNDCWQS